MAMTASRLQSIVASETTKKKLICKIDCYATKKDQIFPDILQLLFFPHGQYFEDIALDHLLQHTNTGSTLKNIQTQKPYIGNNYHHVQFYHHLLQLTQPTLPAPTIHTIYSNNLHCFGKAVGARPDAMSNEYIVEVKCPYGGLRKKIPNHYIVQMFVEMHVANKQKALFVDYYDPRGWRHFVTYIVQLYHHPPKQGQRVFRNDVDTRRPREKIIADMINHTDRDDMIQASEFFQPYSMDNVELQHMIQFTKGDVPSAQTLLHFLQHGKGIRGGTVTQTYYDAIHIQWDRNKHIDIVPIQRFRQNLIHTLNNLEPMLRKIPDNWRAWFKTLKMNNAMPSYMPKDNVYPEMNIYELVWTNNIWTSIQQLTNNIDRYYREQLPFKQLWESLRHCRNTCDTATYKHIEQKTF